MSKSNRKNSDNGSTTVMEQENVEVLGNEAENVTSEPMTSEPVVETITDVDKPAFEDIKAAFDNEGEMQGVWEHVALQVADGNITTDQYKEITGLDYEPIEDTEAHDSESFQAMKMDLESRIAEGKLNVSGATALVDVREKDGKLTSDDAAKLRAWLGTNLGNPILRTIVETYKPTASTMEDIRAEGRNAVAGLISTANEIQTSRISALVLVLADAAHFYMRGNKLPIGTAIARSLWTMVVNDKVLGEPTDEVKGENGEILVPSFDPYKDPTIAVYAPKACQKACLLAYGEITGVCFGYILKENAKRRLNVMTQFSRSIPEGASEDDYLRSVCVPFNVVRPNINSNGQRDDGKPGWELRVVAATKDDSLRPVSDTVGEALYNKYFQDYELVYDILSDNAQKIPTGMLIGSKDPKATKPAEETEEEKKKRETGGTQAEKQTDKEKLAELTKKNEELQKVADAATTANASDMVAFMRSLRAYFRNPNEKVSSELRIEFWHDANELFHRRLIAEKHIPDDAEAEQLASFIMKGEAYFSCDPKDGVWKFQDTDGNVLRTYPKIAPKVFNN